MSPFFQLGVQLCDPIHLLGGLAKLDYYGNQEDQYKDNVDDSSKEKESQAN
jgi:hypothetical protein